MSIKNIQIYGAGLAGLVSAINLARNGYHITVYEKEKKIGGSTKCHPSVHMTPVDIQKMQEYIGIEIESCFSKLESFRGYIGSKKYIFSTKNLYVVERGPRKSSLDYLLYKIALENGVNFQFSYPLTSKNIKTIPENSVIATAGYSQIANVLHLPYIAFKQFNTNMETNLENITIAYFGKYASDYGYISVKNGILFAQLSGSIRLSNKHLNKFVSLVKKTEDIKLNNWSFTTAYLPKKVQLFTKFTGKNQILAGDIAGFSDPFFGFGINGALISGKIAANAIVSKQKALQDFKRFSSRIKKDLLTFLVYWHFPLKSLAQNQIISFHDNNLSLIKYSIPGFTDEDWLKIISVT